MNYILEKDAESATRQVMIQTQGIISHFDFRPNPSTGRIKDGSHGVYQIADRLILETATEGSCRHIALMTGGVP